MNINETIFFTITSCFYVVLLFIAYIFKQKNKVIDNKIYLFLIITNIVEICLELFLCIFAKFYNNSLYIFMNKIYLISLLCWISIFFYYVLSISNNNLNLKFKKILLVFWLFFSLLTVILDIDFCVNNGFVLYSYGTAVDVVYVYSIIIILLMFVLLFINKKNLNDKSYIPIFIYLIVGIVSSIIQKVYPSLLLTCSVEAFITVLMYFTMENPDIKLIEEIRDAKKLTDNANSEKSIFLYNTTQEIKTVINDINTQVEVIENSSSINKCKDSAREITDITTRLLTMNNGIFDTSTLDDKHIKAFNEKYDVKMFLRELVSLYKRKFLEKNISFKTTFDNSIPDFLYGDVYRLKEVIVTILDNSLAYTESGFTELRVNTIIKHDLCRLIFEVEDSGKGMTVSEVEEVLSREEKDINKRCLANCKSILNVIGGTIILSSDYGKGTKVTVVIDQKIYKSETSKKDIISTYSKKYINKKVLLVDDSEVGLKIADKVFDKVDINYFSCTSGKECLDKIRKKEQFDMIFVDEIMDYMSGRELMKRLRRIVDFNTIVILMTSNNNVLYDEEYLKEGFTDYLLKPLTKEKVEDLIKKYLK